MEHNFGKAASVAAVASAATYYMRPSASIQVFGQSVPWWAFTGVAAMGGSLAADLVHDQVFPLVSKDERMRDPISTAAGASIQAATQAGIASIAAPGMLGPGAGQVGTMEILGLAALAEVAGGALYTNLVKPMILNQTEIIAA